MRLKYICIYIVFTALVLILPSSCIDNDYFSGYENKNLISQFTLDEWSLSHPSPYMGYESVPAATAGTTGLPDPTAPILRLENKNLFPDGDFEASTAGSAPNSAYWTASGAGTYSVEASGHPLSGNALQFNQSTSDYLTFNLNNLLDTASSYSSYVFMFDISGDKTGEYYFSVDNSPGVELSEFFPTLIITDHAYSVPVDFTTVPQTEISIHADDSESFRINGVNNKRTRVQSGYIDNIRFVKSDQEQKLSILLPYEDADRVDSLELLSGWYRFSIYVKADPSAGTANRFAAGSVSLILESIEGLGSTSKHLCFNASDYSGFSNWTKLYVNAELQIDPPDEPDSEVIRLSISPCDILKGALCANAGSILISNPSLEYSVTGTF